MTQSAAEKRREARAKKMAERIRWPGICAMCGGEHWQEALPGAGACVLCGIPHLGYCGPPARLAQPRASKSGDAQPAPDRGRA